MPHVENTLQLSDENFEAEVLTYSGVVLVDFWAAWCGPCRAMAPIIGDLASKYEKNEKVKIAQFDIEAETTHPEPTPNKYNVRSIPNFIVFAEGKQHGQAIGVSSAAVLEKLIEEALKSLA